MSDQLPVTWRKPRKIVERIVITGKLELQSPAHFGGGDPDPLSNVKMTLIKDPLTGQALLPGASIAGALRSYLREFEWGYAHSFEGNTREEILEEERKTWAVQLFGGYKGDDVGQQSLVIVDDALAEIKAVELRDGVRIDSATRTAKEDMLFSMEALPVGTTFDLSFELLVPDPDADEIKINRNDLVSYLALALEGLEQGKITLGARKQRGFGACKVKDWRVTAYDLTQPQSLLGWLKQISKTDVSQSIETALVNLNALKKKDKRSSFELTADFLLDGSLLIRSGFGSIENSPDTAHLHILSKNENDKQRVPIIPGTSWAGVLRHRALRIAKTIAPTKPAEAIKLVDGMFGAGNEDQPENKKKMKTSRVRVTDSKIQAEPGASMVQTRVKIDRFTGGAYETGLINEEPLWSNKTAAAKLELQLRNPAKAEIGLLLLVLKDLCTGDLPIGGESSIGRGRLQGNGATLTCFPEKTVYKIEETAGQLNIESGQAAALEAYVKELHQALNGKEAKHG